VTPRRLWRTFGLTIGRETVVTIDTTLQAFVGESKGTMPARRINPVSRFLVAGGQLIPPGRALTADEPLLVCVSSREVGIGARPFGETSGVRWTARGGSRLSRPDSSESRRVESSLGEVADCPALAGIVVAVMGGEQ
jgi:hypothetical protein